MKVISKTLFTDCLPTISTNEELQKIIQMHPGYDPYYIRSSCDKEVKNMFDSLWNKYKFLADKHFLSDCKKHFHQRTWEMYLGVVLIEKGINISSLEKGPDFVINKNKDNEIFIEATTCARGNTEDAVPEEFFAKTPEEIRVQNVPYDKMIMRLTSSLDSKYKKYKDFIEEKRKPYIIAVNRGSLGYLDDIPLILKCLFGLGFQSFKLINNKLVNSGWTRKKVVYKDKGAEVPIYFFEEKKHNIVSAVIYSDKSVLNCSKEIGSDCILIDNPFAKYPIDLNVFSFFKQFKATINRNNMKIHFYDEGVSH